MEPEYNFSKGERGKFYHPDTVLHLPVDGDAEIALDAAEDDGEELEWLQAAARNPAFDFLKDTAEDIYTPADGVPFNDEE
jgi:hypothetical protein